MVWAGMIEKSVARIRYSLHERMDGCRKKYDGGSGSGNWGHAGRPGHVGGSAEGGGRHNRQKDKTGAFTSFSKKRREAARLHGLTMDDAGMFMKNHNTDLRLVDEHGNRYEHVPGTTSFRNLATRELKDFKSGDRVKIILPNSMNPNYSITEDDRKAMAKGEKSFSKALNTSSKKKIDNDYRAVTGAVWKDSSEEAKNALYGYTGSGHESINEALRTGDTGSDALNKKIDLITEALDKSELKRDTVLHRRINRDGAEKLFGLPPGYLNAGNHMDPSNMSMVGRVGTEDGFMSTGAVKGAGLSGNVNLEIMAPKGTKGMYVEPFSMFGEGGQRSWDGEAKQDKFGHEFEFLLQRGCTLQILDYSTDGYNHNIKAVILRQDASASEYSKKRNTKGKKGKTKKTA